MKFWKRILWALFGGLLFGGIGLLLFTARGYYLDYQEFREYTNYKFASVADSSISSMRSTGSISSSLIRMFPKSRWGTGRCGQWKSMLNCSAISTFRLW